MYVCIRMYIEIVSYNKHVATVKVNKDFMCDCLYDNQPCLHLPVF